MLPIVLAAWSSNAQESSYGNAHYLKKSAFALAIARDGGRPTYRNLGYLPPGLLLYKDGTAQRASQISGQRWITWITQHGLTVLLQDDSRTVSRNPFIDNYGGRNGVFHADHYICASEQVECDESNGIEIDRSTAFSATENSGRIDIEFNIEDPETGRRDIRGYLPASVFERLEANGTLTRTDRAHPRFVLDAVQEVKELATACGAVRTEIDSEQVGAKLGVSVDGGVLLRVLRGLGIGIQGSAGAGTGTETTIATSYGGKGEARRFYNFDIREYEEADNSYQEKEYYALVTIACRGPVELVVRELQVSEWRGDDMVSRANVRLEELYPNSLKKEDDVVEQIDRLHDRLDGRLFLTSITGRKEYERIVDVWSQQTSMDIALRHMFMTEFNATCATKHRMECNRWINEIN